MTSVTNTDNKARWVLGIAMSAMIVDGYDVIVFGSAIPALRAHKDWNLSAQDIGQIASLAIVGMLLGALLSGPITDRIGRRWGLIGCITWFSIAMIGVSAAPSPEVLGFFRFIAGLGFGGVLPTAIALTMEWAPPRRKNLSNALVQCGFPAGGILAAFAAIAFLEDFGFRALFLLGALPLVTIVPLAIWRLPESAEFLRTQKSDVSRPSIRQNLANAFAPRFIPVLIVFALANFCSFLLVYALNTWLPELMRTAGFGLGSALSFLLTLSLGAIAGGAVGSAFADRFGNKLVVCIGFSTAAFVLMLISLSPSTGVLYILIAVAGATTLGTQIVLFGYAGTYFASEVRATSVGFSSGVGRLGAIAGPILGGTLVGRDVGFGWSFGVFASVALGGALFTMLAPPTARAVDRATSNEVSRSAAV
ncbi:MFS transporter [Rhodococcus sp. NPDC060176]|uniref:MFS transporter n=1 Tax=Rhodococcus sp. NPDC060176 TaxID=3347062 RepID=UPI0036541D96